jgi:hypothetical protein
MVLALGTVASITVTGLFFVLVVVISRAFQVV